MWKLHRYYLKEIGINAALTFVVLFGIALISLLFKGIKLIEGGRLIDAALTTLLLTADIFPHLLTFAMIFGTVLTFARASQEREITAVRALGISPRVPMVAAMLVGLFCSLIDMWALHYEIPWAHYHKYRVVADIYQGHVSKYLKSKDKIQLEDNGVMTWQKRVMVKGPAGEDRPIYHGVSIYAGSRGSVAAKVGRSKDSDVTFIIAERVWFEQEPGASEIAMILENVYRPDPAQNFEWGQLRITVNLVDMLRGKGRLPGEKDLRSDALLAEVYRGVHRDPPTARYTVHRRASFALLPFLLAPIAFCIGVLARDRGRVLAMSFCMIPLAIVYLADFLSESAMRAFREPLVGWLPTVVVVVGGFPFCWRLLRV